MPIFFLAPGSVRGDTVTVTGPLARHLAGALRHRIGDQVTVVDETGERYRIELIETGSTVVRGLIQSRLGPPPVPPISLTLVQAVLKNPSLDIVIQKAAELGVRRIVPLITRRTVVRTRGDRAGRQAERWQVIAREAAQQSEHAVVPVIDEPLTMDEFLAALRSDDEAKFLFWEREATRGLRESLESRRAVTHATLIVGPEGGFDPDEVRAAAEAGFESVSLGAAILRAETAGPVGLAILQYVWGDLGRTPREPRP
ncbi:MAG: RsmE family RNA methyltransferase [Nitrospiria bacterium]